MFGWLRRKVVPTQDEKVEDMVKKYPKPVVIQKLLAMFPKPQVHDFRIRYWGHSMEKCGDEFAVWSSPRLEVGDRVITENGNFIAWMVEPCRDPPDMVFALFFELPATVPASVPENSLLTGKLL